MKPIPLTPTRHLPLLGILTAVNLCVLLFLAARVRPAEARGEAPVLRGRALEIVDEKGRVRASIVVHPEGRTAQGEPYPDTVILRLIDPEGRPEVKLGASERGGALGLVGATDRAHALLEAKDRQVRLRLTGGDGRERLLEP